MIHKKHSKAFSLIELSVVILIIGILIAGVSGFTTLASKMRLSVARSLTESSPVPGIKNLYFWFDSTSQESFLETETYDGAPLSRWFNITPQVNTSLYFEQDAANDDDHPLYVEECINKLPCVRLRGTATGIAPALGGMTMNMTLADRLHYKDLSIFVVLTTPKDNFSPYDGENNGLTVLFGYNLVLQFDNTGRFTYPSSQGNGVGILYNTPGVVTNEIDTNYIFSVIDDNSDNIYSYRNGLVANGAGALGTYNKELRKIRLGYFNRSSYPQRFKGNIAEIIIYYKALKTEERKSVEEYLSQKWGIGLEA